MSSDDYVTHARSGRPAGTRSDQTRVRVQNCGTRLAGEPRVFALQLSMGAAGAWNLDMTRSARETLPDYQQRSYYEILVRRAAQAA